jgi:protein-S-isoprenylcysteine O-methyltransferase Ste14
MQTVKNALLFLFMLVVLVAIPVEFPSHEWTPMRVAGVVIAAPAIALWFVARVQLGKSFSVRPQAKELVTHGLYSKIRNPIYLFGALFILGVILYAGKREYLLIFVVLVPMQLIRIKKEEKVLEAKFGEAYREYKKSTWF